MDPFGRGPNLEQVVHQHGPELVRFAGRLMVDHHLGEDLVQEVFARLASHEHALQKVRDVRAYLFAAVVNEARARRRRRASSEVLLADPDEDLPAGQPFADRYNERDRLVAVLRRLSPRQRAVLVLRYYYDYGDAEISSILGCPASTVRSHARRGLVALKRALGGATGDRRTSR